MSISILAARRSARRFVDHLRDDCLALGDLAAPSVDRYDDRFVQRIGCRDRAAKRTAI
jgi:hypothetical protein